MRQRLVTTSRGPVAVEERESLLRDTRVGDHVRSGRLARRARTWSSEGGHDSPDQPLAEFLERHARLPASEAETLAAKALGVWLEEWAARGGQDDARWVDRWVLRTLVVVPVVVALAAVGLVSVIVLVINRV